METVVINFLRNQSDRDMTHAQAIKLAPLAKIMNSSFGGNIFLGVSSCINRSTIGRYVGTGFFSYLADVSTGNYCTFGSRVSVGAFSHPTDALTVHEVGYRNTTEWYGETALAEDSARYFVDRSVRTTIGNDVWIGDNSVVIKGIQVGSGSIIAAGAIVTKDVAPYSIVGGNPAKVIRMRFREEIVEKIQATNWWDRSMAELRGIPFQNIELALEMLNAQRNP